MMFASIMGGIVAFALWCITDTSLKPDHVRNPDGRITSWGVLSIVFVQIVLWTLAGFFAAWIVPHLPRFLLTGRRFSVTVFASSILQWFALLMILQYVWTITRATLSTVVVAVMARVGSQSARRALDDGHRQWHFMETGRKVAVDRGNQRKGSAMSQQRLGRWATEAKNHLLKYRPKMAAELQAQGKLDDWALKVSEKAKDEYAMSIENGMQPLEAESEAKQNHFLLPTEEDVPEIARDPNRLPDPASLATAPGVNRRESKRRQSITRI